ncbi:MAG TPA: hypothetical protein VM933_08760 [Acidimicrobiales bacterium]|nr:hypothetical protein [Acidimicrobiales bacterium]
MGRVVAFLAGRLVGAVFLAATAFLAPALLAGRDAAFFAGREVADRVAVAALRPARVTGRAVPRAPEPARAAEAFLAADDFFAAFAADDFFAAAFVAAAFLDAPARLLADLGDEPAFFDAPVFFFALVAAPCFGAEPADRSIGPSTAPSALLSPSPSPAAPVASDCVRARPLEAVATGCSDATARRRRPGST